MESALQVSFYSIGIHWAAAFLQKTIASPLFITSLVTGILALLTFVINFYWPIIDEIEQPEPKFKVRKIRMRVPQKNQKWSGYIYTHLLDDRSPDGPMGKQRVGGTSEVDSKTSGVPEDDTMFDKQALRFLRKTISACGRKADLRSLS